MTDFSMEKVEALMREAAETFILPRFRSLEGGEVEEKTGASDLVTVADREAEAFLTGALEALVPGSKVIGEEAVSAGDVPLELLSGDGPFWLVDPVDGTYNFVQGEERFGVMVAYVTGGAVRRGWILLPIDGRCAAAEEGAGAFFGARRIGEKTARPFAMAAGDYSHTYVEEPYRSAFLKAVKAAGPVRQGRCSAYAYTDLALGRLDYVLQYMMTPWDHAPGQLIVEEAAGRFGFLPGGEPYTPHARRSRPMLCTAAAESWEGYAEHFVRVLPGS